MSKSTVFCFVALWLGACSIEPPSSTDVGHAIAKLDTACGGGATVVINRDDVSIECKFEEYGADSVWGHGNSLEEALDDLRNRSAAVARVLS